MPVLKSQIYRLNSITYKNSLESVLFHSRFIETSNVSFLAYMKQF